MAEEKLQMHSPNLVQGNIKKIAELFPNTLTEVEDENGNVKQAIDFDILKQELADYIVSGKEERYQFTWPEKRNAILLANSPISETLRPCREESVGKDGTPGKFDSENLYIEGDNLDVLKLLQETYLGKIKMIYIDPPYNTGNDFVYSDDFAEDVDSYLAKSGQFDKNGNKLVQNTESNGRFHTDWLNMIYPRLKLAKNLLSDDGIIFISIGALELDNTIKMCDEIFASQNRAGIVSRQMKTGNNQGNFFTQNIDYIVVYAKNADKCPQFKDDMSQELIDNVYNKIQETGPKKGERYRTMGLFQSSLKHGGSRYAITCPDGEKVITPEGLPWRWNEKTFLEGVNNDDVVFIKTKTSPLINVETGKRASWNIYTKIWLSGRLEEGQLPSDLILKFENRHAAKELVNLNIPFDFPKPVDLLSYLCKIINNKDCIILDFFSGSATTAHAVIRKNTEDAGKRKFIMIQLPEPTDEKSEAYKAGYKNICEIGKERIRRAGKKIKEENPLTTQDIDFGFRVLKLDSTNMKDIYYNPAEITQASLDGMIDNIKSDRTQEDLLFQVMIDLGVPLSSKIEETSIAGKKIYNVADNFLAACFDSDVTEEVITAIAKTQPYFFVMRDSSAAGDSVIANFEQIFKTYSPDTKRKVL